MLQYMNQDFNFNGVSVIDDEQIANFYASFTKSNSSINNINMNFNISNVDLYNLNKAAVDADFVAFKDSVLEEASEEVEA